MNIFKFTFKKYKNNVTLFNLPSFLYVTLSLNFLLVIIVRIFPFLMSLKYYIVMSCTFSALVSIFSFLYSFFFLYHHNPTGLNIGYERYSYSQYKFSFWRRSVPQPQVFCTYQLLKTFFNFVNIGYWKIFLPDFLFLDKNVLRTWAAALIQQYFWL